MGGGDTNPYRYAGNDPRNATDPSGHVLNVAAGAIGAVVGGAVGGIWAGVQNFLEYGSLDAALEAAGQGFVTGAVAGGVGGLTFGLSLTVTAGVAAKYGGVVATTAFLGSSAVSAAAGDTYAQLAAIMGGWQDKFSGARVAGAAAGGLLTGGLIRPLMRFDTALKAWTINCNSALGLAEGAVHAFGSVAGGMAGNAATQGLEIWGGERVSFDGRELMMAGLQGLAGTLTGWAVNDEPDGVAFEAVGGVLVAPVHGADMERRCAGIVAMISALPRTTN